MAGLCLLGVEVVSLTVLPLAGQSLTTEKTEVSLTHGKKYTFLIHTFSLFPLRNEDPHISLVPLLEEARCFVGRKRERWTAKVNDSGGLIVKYSMEEDQE